jgi:hypothetical protein
MQPALSLSTETQRNPGADAIYGTSLEGNLRMQRILGSPGLKQIARAGLLALSSLVLGGGSAANAQRALDIPIMTIQIFNNSEEFNIYPLISFPGASHLTDLWLQGLFGTTWANRDAQTYKNGGVIRTYVNCCDTGENGIPPHGSVTIKLPLYTPLVPPDSSWPNGIDPTKSNQVVDWWQGINVNIYKANIKTNAPPAALQALWDDPNKRQKPAEFAKGGKPRCPDATPCTLDFFTSSDPSKSLAIPQGSDPQQLVEGTLGASSANSDASDTNPNIPVRLFDAGVVDYDVSYVNSAYLPVVMEPFGDKRFGWVGTPARIGTFGEKVQSFLKTPDLGEGWPLYKDSSGEQVVGKVPSVLEIMALDIANDPKASNDGEWLPQTCPNPPPKPPIPCPTHFKPYPPNSAPIRALVHAWKKCDHQGDINTFCININAVTKLIRANFDNYVANYKNKLPGWDCDTSGHPDPHPIDRAHLTDLQILQHLYGWTPFNQFCGAGANLLQQTPGYYDPNNKDPTHEYNLVKGQFDALQYWKDVLKGEYGVFHPYLAMIHGPTYINSPFTYAYSVDDAVGNVLTSGTGLIIGVGGLENMPNPDHFTPEIHVNFAQKSLSNPNTFDYYGRCTKNPTTPVNPNFSSFSVPVGITKLATDCVFSLKDNKGRIYLLQIAEDKPAAVCFADKAKCDEGSWVEFTPEISGDSTARLPVEQSCTLNKDQAIRDQWCKFRFAYQRHLHDAVDTIEYHVTLGEPIP